MAFYSYPYNISVYVITGLALLSPIFYGTQPIIIGIVILIYLIYDTFFILSKNNYEDRTPEYGLDQIMKIRSLMSYLFGLYGILFGFLLITGRDNNKYLTLLLDRAQIKTWMLILPLVLAATLLLYVPIRLSVSHSEQSNPISIPGNSSLALKGLLWVSTLLQKIAIFLFVYLLVSLVQAFFKVNV